MGTLDTEDDIITYFNNDINNYCTGVESNLLVASNVLGESMAN